MAGYITTAEEFSAQHYEGASNLYGQYMCSYMEQVHEELFAALHKPYNEQFLGTGGAGPPSTNKQPFRYAAW